MIWVSWPKLTSPLKGDLNENIVREIGLANGQVDVTVVAIDENWSGLKFVFRIKDRPRQREEIVQRPDRGQVKGNAK